MPQPPISRDALKHPENIAFWPLMKRWGISDTQALLLIDQPASDDGPRPKFALSTEQAARLDFLRRIDHQASDIYGNAREWVIAPNGDALFDGVTPLVYMIRNGHAGIERTLNHLLNMDIDGSLGRR